MSCSSRVTGDKMCQIASDWSARYAVHTRSSGWQGSPNLICGGGVDGAVRGLAAIEARAGESDGRYLNIILLPLDSVGSSAG